MMEIDMTNENVDNIRRIQNGSIDYEYYSDIGRVERSREARRMFRTLAKLIRSMMQNSIFEKCAKTQFKVINQPRPASIQSFIPFEGPMIRKAA